MVTALEFHNAWCEVTKTKELEIQLNWHQPANYSSVIMYEDQSVIDLVSKSLGLQHYSEYYCLDKVLYTDQDLVPERPKNTTWLSRIRIALEHENHFNSGLFQEVSHQLITQCELRVLLSYPEREKDIQQQLNHLHSVISQIDLAQEVSDQGSLLFIMGWECADEILWFGCLYRTTGWEILPRASSDTDINTAYQKSDFS